MTVVGVGQNTSIERRGFTEWLRHAKAMSPSGDVSSEERGDRWQRVVTANSRDRLALITAVQQDPELVKSVLFMCSAERGADGFMFWLDHFGWTFDPRKKRGMQNLAFVAFDYQEDMLARKIIDYLLRDDSAEPVDMVIEKSRDMGATWVLLAIFTWALIFIEGFTALLGAQTEDVTDDGGKNASIDSLFGRIRFMLSKLPGWMWRELPEGDDKTLVIQNRLRDSMIMGSPVGKNFGRHGRFTVVFVDEGAWIGGNGEALESAHTACGDTTRFFIVCSTPNGMNYYGQLRHNLLTDSTDGGVLDVVTLHWHYHPLKERGWFDRERARRTRQAFAQEVEISYTASVRGIVFFEFSHDTHVPRNPPIDFFPKLPIRTSFDPGRADAAAFGIMQFDPFTLEHYLVFYIERTQRVIDWFVPFYVGFIPDVDHLGRKFRRVNHYNAEELEAIEMVGSWYKSAALPEMNYGDNAGWQQTHNYWLSAYAVMAQYGVGMYGVQLPSKREAVDKMTFILRHMKIAERCVRTRYGERNAKRIDECLTNYRWPDEPSGGLIRPHQAPLHGVYSHGCDMLQIYCWNQIVPVTTSILGPDQEPLGPERFDRIPDGPVYDRQPRGSNLY